MSEDTTSVPHPARTPGAPRGPVGVVRPSDPTLRATTLEEVTFDSVRLSFDPLRGPFRTDTIYTSVVLTRQRLEDMLSRMDRAKRPEPRHSDQD